MTGPIEPGIPSRIGRSLRGIAGVDETILEDLPSERARYAAMGGVVLGTATIATVSMAVALSAVLGRFTILVVLVVPLWGLFVLNLDRWLVSTSAGTGLRRRLAVLLPRLVLAVAFGVIIAEPLLLGVFRTAIEERVRADRVQDLVDYQSRLRTCNPLPGASAGAVSAAAKPECARLRLVVPGGSPEAARRQLEELQRQANALAAVVKTDTDAYAALAEKARLECDGVDGPGLTGVPGVGYECRRLRQQADAYKSDHQIDANVKRLAGLRTQVNQKSAEVAGQDQTYATRLNAAITARVDERRAAQREIGLLERFRTLGDLVRENGYVFAAEWALRIFLILVDSLPVIVKFMSGVTPYDRIAVDRVEGQVNAELARRAAGVVREGRAARLTRLREEYEADKELRRVRDLQHEAVKERTAQLLENSWSGHWSPADD